MKKIIILLLALALLFTVAACDNAANEPAQPDSPSQPETSTPEDPAATNEPRFIVSTDKYAENFLADDGTATLRRLPTRSWKAHGNISSTPPANMIPAWI